MGEMVMHIVYVTGDFAYKDGDVLTGMPNYMYKIAKYMQGQGHEVSILTVGKKSKKWKYDTIRVYSIRVIYKEIIKSKFVRYVGYPIKRDLAFNRALEIINAKFPISLVQYAGWYGVGMLYSKKFPSVLRISTYTKIQLYAKHTKEELNYISLTERMAAKRFDGIISPSHALGHPYSQDVRRKVTIIETPFSPPILEYEDASILDTILSGKKYFLFFGRISPDKGIYTIARCLYQILEKYPNYCFCFAGEIAALEGNNMMQFLKKSAWEARDRIIYLGNIPHSQLYPVIRKAECVILPSLMDNLPNACLEAMWFNGIVIGTKGASFDEIFEDGISGFLIQIDNSDELIEKIDVVMHMSAQENEKMRIEAKRRLKKFDTKIAGRKLERYYDCILSRRMRHKKITKGF